MAPLPKRKLSKARVREGRQHYGLKLVNLSVCHQCKTLKLPHVVCPTCGTYAGRQVIEIKTAKA